MRDKTPDDLWSRIHGALDSHHSRGTQAADPAVLVARLEARSKLLQQRVAVTDRAAEQVVFAALRDGQQRYGILLSDIVEIQPLEQFTPVPRAPAYVMGVIQWRGAIVSLVNLSLLLAIPQTGIPDYHVYVIVAAAGCRVAIVASEVEEIFKVGATEIQAIAERPGQRPSAWARGIHDGNRLVLQMDQVLRDEMQVDTRETPR